MRAAPAAEKTSRLERLVGHYAMHLMALSNIALAQPLLDTVARNPEFLVAHRAGRGDIFALVAVLLVGIPAVLAATVWASGLAWRGVRPVVLGTLLTALSASLMIQVAVKWPAASADAGASLVTIVIAGSAVAVGAYFRSPGLRRLAGYLGITTLAIGPFFLARQSLRPFMFPPAGVAERAVPAIVSDTPVVLVVFDQLPLVSLLDSSASINESLYPNLAALAADGLWFPRATAVSNESVWAIPAILTGTAPDPSKKAPAWFQYPDTLVSLFAARGVMAHEPVTEFCPPEICGTRVTSPAERLWAELSDLAIVHAHLMAPTAWRARLPPLTDSWNNFGAPAAAQLAEPERSASGEDGWDFRNRWSSARDSDRTVDFLEFVAAIGDDRAQFYFAHVLLPHEPFVYLPSGRKYSSVTAPVGLQPDGNWTRDQFVVAQTYRRHLLQVAHVDGLVGELLARLRQVDLYDRSLVVITADHGASFRAGTTFKHPGTRGYAEILSVPLIVKTPSRSSRGIDDRYARTSDIVATVADALDIQLPWLTDGESLLRPSTRPRGALRFHHSAATEELLAEVSEFEQKRQVALQYKLRLFGSEGDPWVTDFAPASEIIGRPLTELEVSTGDARVALYYPELYADVRRETGFIPADVVGRIDGVAGLETPPQQPVALAVAINGVVQATTWTIDNSTRPWAAWSAVVPEDALLEGHNQVEVFVIERVGEAVSLHRTRMADRDLPVGNLVVESAAWIAGVVAEGFYEQQWSGDTTFRWTNGHGTLSVPIDPSRPPVGLDLVVRHVNPEGARLEVLVDGCRVFRRRLREAIRTRIVFAGCEPTGPTMTLAFVSETFGQPRELGVALSSVVLLDADSRAEAPLE